MIDRSYHFRWPYCGRFWNFIAINLSLQFIYPSINPINAMGFKWLLIRSYEYNNDYRQRSSGHNERALASSLSSTSSPFGIIICQCKAIPLSTSLSSSSSSLSPLFPTNHHHVIIIIIMIHKWIHNTVPVDKNLLMICCPVVLVVTNTASYLEEILWAWALLLPA